MTISLNEENISSEWNESTRPPAPPISFELTTSWVSTRTQAWHGCVCLLCQTDKKFIEKVSFKRCSQTIQRHPSWTCQSQIRCHSRQRSVWSREWCMRLCNCGDTLKTEDLLLCHVHWNTCERNNPASKKTLLRSLRLSERCLTWMGWKNLCCFSWSK